MDVTFRRLARVAAVALVVAIAFLVSDSTRAQPPLSRDFLVTGVRVFDGVQTLQNTQVAVAGGIVRAVGDDPRGVASSCEHRRRRLNPNSWSNRRPCSCRQCR